MKASTVLLSGALALLIGGCDSTPTTSSGGSSGGLPSAGGAMPGGATPGGAMPGGSAPGSSTSGGAGAGGSMPGGSDPGGTTSSGSATAGGAVPGGASTGASTAGSSPSGGAAGGQSIEDLDGELDESLEDFDGRVSGAGSESGDVDILDPSGRNTGGISANVPVFEEAEVGSGDAENPEIEQRAEEGYEGEEPSGDTVAGSAGAGAASYPVPEDIGDGQGDDIVLRQIREAAMKEPDPVLREKLWDEYRRIKDGR